MDRRQFLKNTTAALTIAGVGVAPWRSAQAQAGPIKIGLLAPLTGVVASGGKEMVEGVQFYLDQVKSEMGGRKVELVIEDDASNPDTALQKARRLVEQGNCHMLIGNLLANTGLAVANYVKGTGTPYFIPIIAADDLTQRQRIKNVIRVAGYSASEFTHPLGDWALKQGYKKIATISQDYTFGHEQCGGFFAQRGLAGDVSDVWQKVGGNFTEPLKQASTGLDGKQYFIPFYYYPWAFFYRKSVFEEKGYQPAKTWDELIALAKQMKADNLTPVAFADKDGWPAMGTFDYLNMRLNGYDFHINLMGGKEAWTDPKVAKVFDTWRELLPYSQEGALGRTWQEAAQSLAQKKSGMYLLGMFVGQQVPEADRDDLDFFAFPEVDPAVGTDTVEAPIDGFMLAKSPREEGNAKQLLEYLAGTEAVATYLKSDPNNIAANTKADTSGYNALQKKAVELIGSAAHISQFLDRDTRPDFASTVMIPSLQEFIRKPDDVAGLTTKIENQKKTIFTS